MTIYLKDYDNTYDYAKTYCRENDLEFVEAWFNDINNSVKQEELNELLGLCFCENYGFDVASFLLKKGADINFLNNNYTILYIEVSCQKDAYGEFIYNNEKDDSKLSIEDARKDSYTIVGVIDGIKFLLENGANPNIINPLGKTALDVLIVNEPEEYVFTEAIDLLRKYGAKTSKELEKENLLNNSI